MRQDSFLEALKKYLQRLTEPEPKADAAAILLEPEWARGLLLRTLERVEYDYQKQTPPELRTPRAVSQWLEEWQTGDRIVVFVRELARLLRQGLAVGASVRRHRELIELGLARFFGLADALPSLIQTYELDRLVKEAKKITDPIAFGAHGIDVIQYAVSNQLTIRRQGLLVVSPLGEVFQQLQGRDSVRWLLQVEAQQALGLFDGDRLSRDAAAAILRQGSWTEFDMASLNVDEFPCHGTTANRLLDMGLLTSNYEEDGYASATRWSISALGKELLGELVHPTNTPLTLLAESLYSDLVSSAVQGTGWGSATVRPLAAEASASQARMVAHEIRNALLPVQAALDSLYQEVQVLPPGEVLTRRRPVIDGGIKGALRFTKDLLRTAELGAKPPERFEPVQAVGEVVAELAGTSQVVIVAPTSLALPLLLGRREHFVLAVRNLIENAIQHGGTKLRKVSLEMTLDERREAVRLHIDDDGQGVAEADRDRIFAEGFTNKPGGTGLGLSWVRRVVQEELRGIIVCTQSPLGGARFAVRLPIIELSLPPSAKEKNR